MAKPQAATTKAEVVKGVDGPQPMTPELETGETMRFAPPPPKYSDTDRIIMAILICGQFMRYGSNSRPEEQVERAQQILDLLNKLNTNGR